MTKLFLSSFYFLAFYELFKDGAYFLNLNMPNPNYVMFAKLLNVFAYGPWIYPVFYILGILTLALTIFFNQLIFRIAASFFILLLISMKYSFGHIDHSQHAWMISSVILCLINTDKDLHAEWNHFVLRLTQSLLLCPYFIAGIWKLRDLHFPLAGIAFNNISSAIAEGSGPNHFIKNILFVDFPFLVTLGFIAVILFECSAFVPIVTGKYFRTWGILAILFHFATGVAMGIRYSDKVILLGFFFIFSEYLIEHKFCSSPERDQSVKSGVLTEIWRLRK